MAKGKKYVYIQLYSKDLLADEKLAKCDKASAWGAYLALLNIMAMEPVRGCLRLRDWDTHPENARKSLVANFHRANTLRAKAAAFARIVVQCTPLKLSPIAEGIEQLLTFGVIVMHDDAIIQPRMFRESRSQLEGYTPEPESEQEDVIVIKDDKASTPTPPQHTRTPLDHAPARALRANMRDSIIEREYENKNNIGNIGGVGGTCAVEGENVGETEMPSPTPDDGFSDFWQLYDKRYADGRHIKADGAKVLWQSLTDEEREAAMQFLPKYIEATPKKQYRMHPYRYLNERAWLTVRINGGRVEPSVPQPAEDDKPVQIPVADCPPTLEQIQAYMQEQGELGRIFRYITAEEYYDEGCKSGWMQRGGRPLYDWKAQLRSFEAYRRNHGDTPVAARGQQPTALKHGDPVQATPPKDGKYRKW